MSPPTISNARRSLRLALSAVFRFTTTIVALSMGALSLWILVTLIWRGTESLRWITGVGASSVIPGIVDAIIGSVVVVGLALILAVPLGLVIGIYLSASDGESQCLRVVRFIADALSGMPSIVVGACVYFFMAYANIAESWLAGSVALALLLAPRMACTTSSSLSLVSPDLREAALALGAPAWRILLLVSMRAAIPGIVAAGLLSVARVAGEVAPLLLLFPPRSPSAISSISPIPTLHVQAYRFLFSADAYVQSLAWTAALILTVGIAAIVLLARRVRRQQ